MSSKELRPDASMSTIVVICFFPAFSPASSGGELRLGNLYRALSETHDVVLLTSTDFGARFEEINHTPRFRELRFPKDDLWRAAYATLGRSKVSGELSGLAFALAVSDPRCALRNAARELAATSDFVIHEFPFSEPIFSDGCPCPEIYNSHNFEASLLPSIVQGDGFDTVLLKLMRLERNLAARAWRVLATSAADAEKFRLFYGVQPGKLGLCPNGFDPAALQPVVTARRATRPVLLKRPKLLFMGSAHHPNVEAAEFVIAMAVTLADCDFIVAGGVCGAFDPASVPANVHIVGPFDNAAKLDLLSEADLFLNPVVLGSGTSLKALEAFGADVPMVSTPEGVRGLGVESGTHCVVASRERFAEAVGSLIRDPELQARLSATGLEFATRQFAWATIASKLGDALGRSVDEITPHRPVLLAFNDYSVMHPGSGGIARVRNLLDNLSCDVVLVSFASSFAVQFISDRVMHVTVAKSQAQRALEDALTDGQPASVNDAVASLYAGSNRALIEIVTAMLPQAQAVIFEHPYLAPLLDVIRAARSDLPVIYSAHNVEALHKVELLKRHSIGGLIAQFIGELEARLVAAAALVVCCTEADAQHFKRLGAETIVVPNGCTLPELPPFSPQDLCIKEGDFACVGFMGSGHGPNAEAAEFIVRELAPHFPEIRFEMVGSVCESLTGSLPSNLVLHGLLQEARKTEVMRSWDVALNPILTGGGSSLKLPDYLAHGLATLNTPAGARSFPIDQLWAGRVVPRRQFRAALSQLLVDRATLKSLAANARLFAETHLSWEAICRGYRERLVSLLIAPRVITKRPTLLVITYRYTEPPLGGAEEYLIEVLKRIRPSLGRMDLAAVDIEQLTNHHHFGCQFTAPPGGAALRVGELFDQARYFPAVAPAEGDAVAHSRALERAWCQEDEKIYLRFAERLSRSGRLRVFGGFFWPENHDGVIRRWTSPTFSFLVPRTARVFQMSGYAAADKTARVTFMRLSPDGQLHTLARHDDSIQAHFKLNVALPRYRGEDPLLLRVEVDEHVAPGDHRPFGVLLEYAAVLSMDNDVWDHQETAISRFDVSVANLSELHEEEMRTRRFEAWVAALRDNALARSAQIESAFAAVRGPHAPTLYDWLARHANDYDTVLVQGIPFDVIPRVVETLNALPKRPRVVTLPHFHGDDRFYYWRRYLDAFRDADTSLLFSGSLAEGLRGNGHFALVPGGGVRSDEYADVDAERSFRELHPDSTPFFLVLGRKTGSKGYRQIIDAHQALRNEGVATGLVMIGPDEDGQPVTGEGIRYLGRQPRAVVRGALRSCAGLISMSQSESFGIVLIEAWMFEKAVIANRACYSFRELVRDKETGHLVSTPAELMAAMRSLLDHPADAARMGRAGFEEALERFTWERVAAACLSEFVDLSSPDFQTARLEESSLLVT